MRPYSETTPAAIGVWHPEDQRATQTLQITKSRQNPKTPHSSKEQRPRIVLPRDSQVTDRQISTQTMSTVAATSMSVEHLNVTLCWMSSSFFCANVVCCFPRHGVLLVIDGFLPGRWRRQCRLAACVQLRTTVVSRNANPVRGAGGRRQL